jgi:hypothetical protein
LRSILYRLQLKIKRSTITAQEQSKTQNITPQLYRLQKQYDYIEAVAYQLYKKMYAHIKAKTEQSFFDRDHLFLINMLKALITQKENPMVVDAVSFDILTSPVMASRDSRQPLDNLDAGKIPLTL